MAESESEPRECGSWVSGFSHLLAQLSCVSLAELGLGPVDLLVNIAYGHMHHERSNHETLYKWGIQ